jgi:MFS family permease
MRAVARRLCNVGRDYDGFDASALTGPQSPALHCTMNHLTSYVAFARRNGDHLLFGSLLLALSSFGQTYFVSLFGEAFRATFGLTDGGLGTAYAIGTAMSALTLTWAGRLIDATTVRRYTWCVAGLLGAACLLTAASPWVPVLCLSFYLLRLGGQGLMVHTALTATARTFPADAGKALGIIALGFSVAQAVMPLSAVAIMHHVGWRATWVIGAGVVLAGTALALRFLPREAEDHNAIRARRASLRQSGPALWRDKRLFLTLPVVLASPFICTGFFFHQARLAEEKHWALSWVAGWFVAYAVTQAVALLAAGPVIDRFGPKRLLPVFLAPQGLAMLFLGLSDAPWVAPAYLILTGMSSAVASTLATALWVELYGPAMLARVRSVVEAGSVIATGASPILMGMLIDRGIPLSAQALGCCAYVALSSVLALLVQAVPDHDISAQALSPAER